MGDSQDSGAPLGALSQLELRPASGPVSVLGSIATYHGEEFHSFGTLETPSGAESPSEREVFIRPPLALISSGPSGARVWSVAQDSTGNQSWLAPNPIALKPLLIPCAVLLAMLCALGVYFEIKRVRQVCDVEIPMGPSRSAAEAAGPHGAQANPVEAASSDPPGAPAADPAPIDAAAIAASRVRFLPAFDIDESTVLQFELSRDASHSAVQLGVALLEESSQELIEFALNSTVRPSPDGDSIEGSLRTTERVGGIKAGRYMVRIDPSWEPWDRSAPTAPQVRLVVFAGKRPPWMFVLAFVALLIPPVLGLVRYRRFEKARRSSFEQLAGARA